MQLFLEPLDVWLFRDGRPFDALSDHRAETVFPPYPTVIQGALRSHQLALSAVDLTDRGAIKAAVGDDGDYKGLRVRGPLLGRRNAGGQVARLYPLPADATGRDGEAASLTPTRLPAGVSTSLPLPLALLPTGTPHKAEWGGWVDLTALDQCLAGKVVPIIPAYELYHRESRFGIGLETGRRTTVEGALYEVEFVRLSEGVGLWVEVDGYGGWPAAGLMRIGGEARGAAYSMVEGEGWPAPTEPLPARFKLYFATPTFFETGWQPVSWTRFFEGDVKLVSAAVNRYESMGGFSWASDPKSGAAHRAARRFVPAGSVYFFESKAGARLRNGLTQNAVTDYGAEIGFGQVIIRGW